jgi:hypothetical protein
LTSTFRFISRLGGVLFDSFWPNIITIINGWDFRNIPVESDINNHIYLAGKSIGILLSLLFDTTLG